jgi:hypothetical protein
MRWIKLTTTDNAASVFTCNLSSTLTIGKDAKVACKSIFLNTLDQNYVTVPPDIGFKITIVSGYTANISLIPGEYTQDEFCDMVDNSLNKAFAYSSNIPTSIFGFQWKTSITPNGAITMTFNRCENIAASEKMQTSTGIQGDNVAGYTVAAVPAADSAYINTTDFANMGIFYQEFTITPTAGTTPKYTMGLATTSSGLSTLPISQYQMGVSVNTAGNLISVVNGVAGAEIQNSGSPIPSSNVKRIALVASSGAIQLYITFITTGTTLILTLATTAQTNFATSNKVNIAATLNSINTNIRVSYFYKNPYYTLLPGGQLIDGDYSTIVYSDLTLTASKVIINFGGDLISQAFFNIRNGGGGATPAIQAVTGFFIGGRNIVNNVLQTIIIEIASLSQIEAYDTSSGYKKPILYVFPNIPLGSDGYVGYDIVQPIPLSLKNKHELALSAFTLRITDAYGQPLQVGKGSIVNILIEDDS